MVVPVDFLTDEQVATYGRFGSDLSRSDLERFFFLDDRDRDLLSNRRGDHNRLGFAVQLGTVRCLGLFLSTPIDVPGSAVEYLAVQLDIADPAVLEQYAERLPTQHEHAREIRQAYGYHDFSDAAAREQLREFMEGRAWTHAEGALALFTQATAWLRRHRILLPGPSVLARLVLRVRDEAADRMYRTLAEAATSADPELPCRLQDLLQVRDQQRVSDLELLRRAPTRTSGMAMSRALDRVSVVLAVGAWGAQVQAVPANRLMMLARYGLTAKAPLLKALAEPRRTAALLATARHLEAAAVDDALDLFDLLMATRILNPARRAVTSQRLANMPKLEKASTLLLAPTFRTR